jgi:hypothetical protein
VVCVGDKFHLQAKVDEIGELWTGLLRTGGMADQISAVDEDTILINIADGKYMDEVSRLDSRCNSTPGANLYNSTMYHHEVESRRPHSKHSSRHQQASAGSLSKQLPQAESGNATRIEGDARGVVCWE